MSNSARSDLKDFFIKNLKDPDFKDMYTDIIDGWVEELRESNQVFLKYSEIIGEDKESDPGLQVLDHTKLSFSEGIELSNNARRELRDRQEGFYDKVEDLANIGHDIADVPDLIDEEYLEYYNDSGGVEIEYDDKTKTGSPSFINLTSTTPNLNYEIQKDNIFFVKDTLDEGVDVIKRLVDMKILDKEVLVGGDGELSDDKIRRNFMNFTDLGTHGDGKRDTFYNVSIPYSKVANNQQVFFPMLLKEGHVELNDSKAHDDYKDFQNAIEEFREVGKTKWG